MSVSKRNKDELIAKDHREKREYTKIFESVQANCEMISDHVYSHESELLSSSQTSLKNRSDIDIKLTKIPLGLVEFDWERKLALGTRGNQ